MPSDHALARKHVDWQTTLNATRAAATKTQEAHDAKANVAQVIEEQNQALLLQQQEVQGLQQRLQQEHQDYEIKYKGAIEEVAKVTQAAAQELETYKKALATRED